MSIPDTLRSKIDLFASNGRIFRVNDELFGETSWLQVMFGQGIKPTGYHALTDNVAPEKIEKMVAQVKQVMHAVVSRMPTHESFIASNCKALPM